MSKPTWNRFNNVNFKGKIHSVYHKTLNILTSKNLLLTLTDTTFKSAPNLFRVTNFNFEQLDLVPNLEVIFKNNTLLIDQRILIDYSKPFLEQPEEVVISKLDVNFFQKLQKIKTTNWYLEKTKAFQEHHFVEEMHLMIKTYSQQLKLAIEQQQENEIGLLLKKFIGLGIGLTPSGDDFLTGLAYVSSLKNYPNQQLLKLLSSLEPLIKQETNLISWQEFSMALQGEIRSEVINATKAILLPKSNEKEIQEILTIGSTSGFDLLEGILFGLEVLEVEVYKEIHNDVKRKNFKKSLYGFSIVNANIKQR